MNDLLHNQLPQFQVPEAGEAFAAAGGLLKVAVPRAMRALEVGYGVGVPVSAPAPAAAVSDQVPLVKPTLDEGADGVLDLDEIRARIKAA